MLTMTQRIEAGADRGHDLTFVVGGDHVSGPVPPAPRRGPRLRRQPPGPGRRPGRPRGPARPDVAAARHRDPGDLAERRHRRRAAAARCACRRSRSSSPRPGCGSRTPTSSLVLVDPELAPFIEPVPGDPPMVGWDAVQPGAGRARRRRLGAARRRPRSPRDPAVHQRVDLRPQGRDAPAPHGGRQPRRHRARPRRSTRTTTCSCRGCRCTTTWAWWGCFSLSMTHRARRSCSARPRTSWPAPAAGWSGSPPTAAPPPPGPNFSYVLAARALRRGDALDLSRLRIALNGAEPVDPGDGGEPSSRPASATACGPARCSPPSGWPRWPSPAPSRSRCPGCAPTPSTAGCSRRSATPRRSTPTSDGRPRSWPSSGGRSQGLEIRVVDPVTGDVLQDREVGELEIRGTSVTPGYYKRPDANAELFHDGWLRTGDLAYLVDGEMVMCGRIKDMIIVGGRNVFPEDVERALAERRRRAGRQRDRLRRRRRAGQGGARRGGREQVRRPRRGASLGRAAGARRHRPAGQGDRARRARQPPQDQLRASSSARSARSATSARSSRRSEPAAGSHRVELLHDGAPAVGVARVGRVEADALHDVAVALLQPGGELLGLGDHGEGVRGSRR